MALIDTYRSNVIRKREAISKLVSDKASRSWFILINNCLGDNFACFAAFVFSWSHKCVIHNPFKSFLKDTAL